MSTQGLRALLELANNHFEGELSIRRERRDGSRLLKPDTWLISVGMIANRKSIMNADFDKAVVMLYSFAGMTISKDFEDYLGERFPPT